MERKGALEGIRVLDLGYFLSAPRCGQILAEQGADVIKIEPPHGDTMRLLMSLAGAEKILSIVNANKRGIILNFRNEAGRELFKELVKVSDVVLENFKHGFMEDMGLGYEELEKINPRIVYASIYGFGSTGALRDRPAFDLIAQASSGIMHALDMHDRPPPIFFGDLISGAYAAMGISFALFSREKTGQGQRVDISMQDVMYYHQFQAMSIRAMGDTADDTAGILGRSMHNLLTDRQDPLPFWNSYRGQDGFVGVAALTDSQWRRMMKAIGRDDLVDDPRFSNFITRVHNSRAGVKIIAQWAAKRSCDEIVQALSEQRVPCAKVISAEEVNEDPQLKERGMLAEVEHASLGKIGVPGSVFKMSRTPGQVRTAHPGLGEHTEEVLKELLGLDDAQIAELEAKGAI